MNNLQTPISANELDRIYHVRKGTARKAFENGHLVGTIRMGRGGKQLWILPSMAEKWFISGMLTEKAT